MNLDFNEFLRDIDDTPKESLSGLPGISHNGYNYRREASTLTIKRTLLPNGVRIVTEQIDYVQSASIGIWVGAGSRDETERIRGISHVIEHMLFKGTKKRSAEQIALDMDRIGGYLNAFTEKEHTCYYARVLSEHISDCLDILTDMFLRSIFPDDEFEREKKVILEEIKERDDQPDDLVHDLFYETIWPNHGLGKAVIGSVETVSSLTRQDLFDYIANQYTPDRIVVAAAGNLNHDAIVDQLSHLFSSLPAFSAAGLREESTPQSAFTKTAFSKPVEQVQLVMGAPAFSLFDERKYDLGMLDIMLGGGMSSRLFQEVREKRGLAYTIGAYSSAYREGGLFSIYAGTGMETLDEVIDISRDQCFQMAEGKFSDDELLRAKIQARAALEIGLESMSSRMNRLGKDEIIFGKVISREEIVSKIESVTVKSVQEVASQIFSPKHMAIALVGPFDEDDQE
jgi:predicted Zn-dependent peptidase